MRAGTQRLTSIPVGLIAALAMIFAPATDDAQPFSAQDLTLSSADGIIGAQVLAPTFDQGVVSRRTIPLAHRQVRATLIAISQELGSSALAFAAGGATIVVAGAAAGLTFSSQKPRVPRAPPEPAEA
jgi:hypothetical protein